jgi:hypothetical protein
MKIQIVQQGTKKNSAKSVCPWFIDEPPAAKK